MNWESSKKSGCSGVSGLLSQQPVTSVASGAACWRMNCSFLLWGPWLHKLLVVEGFPGGANGNPPAKAGGERDSGLIPGFGKIPLEEEMAAHSSILAWRIPWTEEPGGVQSIGSQRVGHN